MARIGNASFAEDKEQTPAESRGLLPKWRYNVDITAADYKETNAQTGWYAKYELTIADGEYRGRKLWIQFNLEHQNADAQRIGRAQFKSFAKMAGHPNPDHINDTDELIGKRIQVAVILKGKETDQYGIKNEIDNWFPFGTAIPAPGSKDGDFVKAAPVPAPQAPQAPIATKEPVAPIVSQPAGPVIAAVATPAPAVTPAAVTPEAQGDAMKQTPVTAAADPFFDDSDIPPF